MSNSVYNCDIINLPKIDSNTGTLSFLENSKHLPFDVNRVFYLYDVPSGESRGAHAHYHCKQFLIAASGSFEVILDDGNAKRSVFLNQPDRGLLIPELIWASEVNFSAGAICLVLTSDLFDESDYIRDYNQFKKIVRNG